MLEHQHVEPLRRRVDGGGETRRPCANDDHVPRGLDVELGAQAKPRGQRLDRRLPQDLAPLAHDHRYLVDPDVEPIQQRLHVWLALHLLVGERLSVSDQELSDAQRVCRMTGADEDQAADAVGDERHPPQDEGAHEDFAELEVPLDESAQMLAIDDDDRSVAESPAANEGATRGQHVDLAREFPGTVDGDLLFAAVGRAHDLNGPFDDHEEAGVLLSNLEQDLAGAHAASLAHTGDPAELRRSQLGEHLVAAVHVRVGHRSTVR